MDTSPATIDMLIEARWIVPVEPAGVVLEHHAVAVKDGRIVAVLPSDRARQQFKPATLRVLDEHVLIPGLVNLHAHAAMNLLRGYADDQPLMRWLNDHIWPAEQRHVSHDFVRDGTLLACAEMLRGGVTCFSDMYFFPDAAAEAVLEAGIRAALGVVIIEFPSAWATDADQYISRGLAVRDRYKQEPHLHFTLAPHAPYTVSDATFERVRTLAEQLDLPIHMHIHETRDEIEQSVQQHGMRPLERLRRLGLVSPHLIGVHAVHLTDDEIALLAREGASVAHCPTSNMKLASGAAPVAAFEAAGIGVGLGTDGAASNNRLDLFQEMRHAGLMAKLVSGDAAALPAQRLLHMATLGGARALGLEHEIGSITVGKSADLCAVALTEPETRPCYSPVSHLVYVTGREHVSDVWVSGIARVMQGDLLHPHNNDLKARARLWQNQVAR
jgi:5-methylthioadenosine/S-adenosylhomocysteine deaminase